MDELTLCDSIGKIRLPRFKSADTRIPVMRCGLSEEWKCGSNKDGKRIVCEHECRAGKRMGKVIKARCSIVGGIVGLVSKSGAELVSTSWMATRCKGRGLSYQYFLKHKSLAREIFRPRKLTSFNFFLI